MRLTQEWLYRPRVLLVGWLVGHNMNAVHGMETDQADADNLSQNWEVG